MDTQKKRNDRPHFVRIIPPDKKRIKEINEAIQERTGTIARKLIIKYFGT